VLTFLALVWRLLLRLLPLLLLLLLLPLLLLLLLLPLPRSVRACALFLAEWAVLCCWPKTRNSKVSELMCVLPLRLKCSGLAWLCRETTWGGCTTTKLAHK
jgi:hypothetical protein